MAKTKRAAKAQAARASKATLADMLVCMSCGIEVPEGINTAQYACPCGGGVTFGSGAAYQLVAAGRRPGADLKAQASDFARSKETED